MAEKKKQRKQRTVSFLQLTYVSKSLNFGTSKESHAMPRQSIIGLCRARHTKVLHRQTP